jgi:hypothetical protein
MGGFEGPARWRQAGALLFGGWQMDDLAVRRTTGWVGLLDRLWYTLAWPRLTVILLVWVAVILGLSTVIPQAPPHIEDPIVRSQWLASVPANARPVVERLQTFGVFNLLDSIWLRLPLALLLAHVLVVLADLGPAVWRRVGGLFRSSSEDSPGGVPRVDPIESWGDEACLLGKSFRLERDWPEPTESVGHQVISRLEKSGYRVLVGAEYPSGSRKGQNESRQNFVASRLRWSWLGLVGIYLGLGLVTAGLVLVGWLGRVQEMNLEPDNPTPLPMADAPTLVLDEVAVAGTAPPMPGTGAPVPGTGAARDGDPTSPATGVASMLILTEVGESQRLTLKLHSSRLFRGVWLTLVDLRPVAEVAAVDAETGESVLLQPFSAHTPSQERIRLPLTENPEARFVGVPSKNVTLQVDYQAGTQYPPGPQMGEGETQPSVPVFSLSLFRGAEARPSYSISLPDGGEKTFDGVRYQVALDYDVLLRANSTLSWLVVAAGWGATALSFFVLAVAPPAYIRGQVKVKEEKTKVKSSRVILMVEVLGDEQRLRQELRALVTP